MGLFSRRRGAMAGDEADPGEVQDAGGVDDAEVGSDVPGPWDVADHPSLDGMVDLGALRIPAVAGIKFGLELDKPGGQPVALALSDQDSTMLLRVFAAPKTQGIWEDVMEEMAQSVKDDGGTSSLRDGRFGTEVVALLPAKGGQGKAAKRPMRVIGIDGPRWFLRAIVTGRAAEHPERARRLEDLLASTVVVRGDEARPPRELLPLRPPGREPGARESAKPGDASPFERGPEITEVR